MLNMRAIEVGQKKVLMVCGKTKNLHQNEVADHQK